MGLDEPDLGDHQNGLRGDLFTRKDGDDPAKIPLGLIRVKMQMTWGIPLGPRTLC